MPDLHGLITSVSLMMDVIAVRSEIARAYWCMVDNRHLCQGIVTMQGKASSNLLCNDLVGLENGHSMDRIR